MAYLLRWMIRFKINVYVESWKKQRHEKVLPLIHLGNAGQRIALLRPPLEGLRSALGQMIFPRFPRRMRSRPLLANHGRRTRKRKK